MFHTIIGVWLASLSVRVLISAGIQNANMTPVLVCGYFGVVYMYVKRPRWR